MSIEKEATVAYLLEQELSPNFANTVAEYVVGNRKFGRKTDAFAFYYSEDLSLYDVAEISDLLNALFWRVLEQSENDDVLLLRDVLQGVDGVFRVREFRVGNSIFFGVDIPPELIEYVAQSIGQAAPYLLGVLRDGIVYDMFKGIASATRKGFGRVVTFVRRPKRERKDSNIPIKPVPDSGAEDQDELAVIADIMSELVAKHDGIKKIIVRSGDKYIAVEKS